MTKITLQRTTRPSSTRVLFFLTANSDGGEAVRGVSGSPSTNSGATANAPARKKSSLHARRKARRRLARDAHTLASASFVFYVGEDEGGEEREGGITHGDDNQGSRSSKCSVARRTTHHHRQQVTHRQGPRRALQTDWKSCLGPPPGTPPTSTKTAPPPQTQTPQRPETRSINV